MPPKWNKAKEAVEEMKKMVAESASWSHVQAVGLCMHNAGKLMFGVDCFARRDGSHLYAVKFHLMPGKQTRPLERFLLAAFVYKVWLGKCTELFGDEQQMPHLAGSRLVWAHKNSDARLFKALDKALDDVSLKYNPAIDQLALNVRAELTKLDTPVEMYTRDLIYPLKKAIERGASREDLIRLVDEAFVEEVQKS